MRVCINNKLMTPCACVTRVPVHGSRGRRYGQQRQQRSATGRMISLKTKSRHSYNVEKLAPPSSIARRSEAMEV